MILQFVFLLIFSFIGSLTTSLHAQNSNVPVSNSASPAKSTDASKIITSGLGVAIGYTKEFSPTEYKLEDCTVKNKYDVCIKIKNKRKEEAKLSEILIVSQKACELKPKEACAGLFALARQVGGVAVFQTQKLLEQSCIKFAEVCDEVSGFYEDQKDFGSAINFSRKYYLKFQKGNFAKFSYQYGDKNEAFAASLVGCQKEPAKCAEYLKLMPDHNQLLKILEGAEKDCKAYVKMATPSSCVLVGSHYFNIGNYNKAYDYWSIDCDKNNAYSCFYIMGSSIDDLRKNVIFEKFCRIPLANLNASHLSLQKMNCVAGVNKATEQLKAVGVVELKLLSGVPSVKAPEAAKN
jgi:hypothetical protein